jgi:outer membrane protein assembly factor BamB
MVSKLFVTSRRSTARRGRTLASNRLRFVLGGLVLGALAATSSALLAADWPEWRGPARDGLSAEKGLPEKWSPAGENLAWKIDIGSRSGPIVIGDKVCLMTHAGAAFALEAPDTQERVVCVDANSGKIAWEHKVNMFHSDVPAHRVGWASPAADPATGNIYALGTGAMFVALSKDGKLLWEHSLNEEYGFVTTHGGRTTSPIIEGDLVIVTGLNAGWGALGRTGNRYFAFNKKTGELVWSSAPQTKHYDTNYSTPIAATVNGTRLILVGGTDGCVHALKAATGEPVWKFEMTKRAVNTSVVMHGNDAIVTHSEENLDTSEMGLLAAVDATATGTITPAQLRWSSHGFQGGFASPVLDEAGGRFYEVDNGAILAAFDLKDGHKLWDKKLGTLQKSSPVFADGKLYIGTENGKFYILKPTATGADVLDEDELKSADGTDEPVIGSPAIANGRVYVVTMRALYAIGPKTVKPTTTTPAKRGATPAKPGPAAATTTAASGPAGAPAAVQVTPNESVLTPTGKIKVAVALFDAKGQPVTGAPPAAPAFTLEGLKGTIAPDGTFTPDATVPLQAGVIKATVGTLAGTARVRVLPPLPLAYNFDDITGEAPPLPWINAVGKFVVKDLEGSKVLSRLEDNTPGRRARLFLGNVDMADYTMEADVRVGERRRQMGDAGVIAQRYSLVLFGNAQKLELQPWQANPAMTVAVAPFAWKAEVWYRLKLRVENLKDGTTRVQGKVWPRDEPEPAAWTVEKIDKIGHKHGAPGIYADALAGAYYDNLKVTSLTSAGSH